MTQGNTIDGIHLIVDGAVRDPVVFSEHHLREMFLKIVSDLKMTIIEGPLFKHVPVDPSKLGGNSFRDEGGVSGYCMISTSHISIHCWPLRRIFMLDAFSCCQFDADAALGAIQKFLEPTKLTYAIVRRQPPESMQAVVRKSQTL